MANKYEQVTSTIITNFQETDPKYNDEVKADRSGANPYHSRSREIFGTYFMSRHESTGALKPYGDGGDGLSAEQRREFNHYTTRKMFESGLLKEGYEEDDIAIMRQWDADLEQAALTGNVHNLLASGKLLTENYREAAVQQYNWDESMYNKYVASSRYIAEQVFDPDGDGILNITDQAIDSIGAMNSSEIQSIFNWMSDDQKSMLGFDGVHDSSSFEQKMRESYSKRQEAQKTGAGSFGDWIKAVGHGIIQGLTELVTLIPMAIGAVAMVGGKDNIITQTMFKASKSVEDAVVGGYDEAVGVNKNTTAYKVGNIMGQAVEIAAEAALTMGLAPIVKKGLQKGAIKVAEKTIAKTGERVAAKTITEEAAKGIISKAEHKIAKNSAKLIEREAYELAKKAGSKSLGEAVKKKILGVTVTEEVMAQAVKNVSKKIGIEVGEKGAAKAFEKAATTAIVRLSKRGVMFGAGKALEELGIKGAKEAIEAGSKTAIKKAAQEAGESVARRNARELASSSMSGILTGQTSKALMKAADHETYLKLIGKMAQRPGPLRKSLSFAFGKTDALTKLFASKAFANTVQQGHEKGYNNWESIFRGILAFGTSNMIWGKLVGSGETTLGKLFENMKAGPIKSIGAWGKIQLKEVATIGTKMIADGFAQELILTGMTKGMDGKLSWFGDSISTTFNLKSIAETYLNALTMHGTTVGIGAVRRGTATLAQKNPYMKAKTKKSVLSYINTEMSKSTEEGGITAEVWEAIKNDARQKLKKERNLTDDQASRIKEEEILDTATALALEQGGALALLVRRKVTEGGFQQHGIEVGTNLKNIRDAVEIDIAEIGKTLNKLANNNDVTQANDESMAVRNADEKFRLFVQYIATDRYFDKNDPSKTEILNQLTEEGYEVKKFTPDEALVAYSFFKENASKSDFQDERIKGTIESSFKQAANLKKKLGKKAWSKIIGLKDEYVSYLSRKLNNVFDAGKAKAFEDFRSELSEAINNFRKEGSKDREALNIELKRIVEKHNAVTNDTKSDAVESKVNEVNIDEQTADGNPISNSVAETVKESKQLIVKEAILAETNGDAKKIKDVIDKVYEFGKEGKTDKEVVRDAQKVLLDLEKSLKEGYGGKKQTKSQYRSLVADVFSHIVKESGIDVAQQPSLWEARTITELSKKGITNKKIGEIKLFADAVKKYNDILDNSKPTDEGVAAKLRNAKAEVKKYENSAKKFNEVRDFFNKESDQNKYFDEVIDKVYDDVKFNTWEIGTLLGSGYEARGKELTTQAKEAQAPKETVEEPTTEDTPPPPAEIAGTNAAATKRNEAQDAQIDKTLGMEKSISKVIEEKAKNDPKVKEEVNEIKESAKAAPIEMPLKEKVEVEPKEARKLQSFEKDKNAIKTIESIIDEMILDGKIDSKQRKEAIEKVVKGKEILPEDKEWRREVASELEIEEIIDENELAQYLDYISFC